MSQETSDLAEGEQVHLLPCLPDFPIREQTQEKPVLAAAGLWHFGLI